MPADTSTSDSGARILTASPRETGALAAALGALCEGGEAIALFGILGAGKTLFAKGLARGLAIDPREVTSPSYLLIHELYGRLRLVHVDAYRVGREEELLEVGFAEMLGPETVLLVEWADRVPDLLPEDRLEVHLQVTGPESRRLGFTAVGRTHEALLARVRRVHGERT